MNEQVKYIIENEIIYEDENDITDMFNKKLAMIILSLEENLGGCNIA